MTQAAQDCSESGCQHADSLPVSGRLYKNRIVHAPGIALLWLLPLFSCGANSDNTISDVKLSGTVFSVNCEDGWQYCYGEARRRCTNNDFEEIDYHIHERAISDDRLRRMADMKAEPKNRTMTVRCK